MKNSNVSYEDFYSLIARYLFKQRLINEAKFTSARLVVHEIHFDADFEFTLSIKRLDGGK